MPRTCENCGMRMPAFKPRKKADNGGLWCQNCHEGRPGRPRAEGSLDAEAGVADFLLGPEKHPKVACPNCRGEGSYARGHGRMTCQTCNGTGRVPSRYPRAASLESEAGFLDVMERVLPKPTPLAPGVCGRCSGRGRIMGVKSAVTCPRCRGTGKLAIHTLAHDSGDGETIYHCPFCGGGQVVGRSDGTVECDFCQTAFTVQVQPQMSGQPQTGPDGQPLPMPGMPGDPSQREAPPAPEDDEFAVLDPEQTSPAAGATPSGGPGGAPVDVNEEFAVLSKKANRFYLTGEGVLDEDAYVRHLAIRFADDKAAVVADIRRERGR